MAEPVRPRRRLVLAISLAVVAGAYVVLSLTGLTASEALAMGFGAVGHVALWSEDVVAGMGEAGVFVLMLLESSSLPVPSEVVLPFAGFLSSMGRMNFWLALMWATVGSMIGSYVDYYIGAYLGSSFMARRNVVSRKALETAHAWFIRYGAMAVFGSRFVAGARTLVSFPAGASRMNVWKFGIFTLAGCFIWNALLMYAGYVLGANWDAAVATFNSAYSVVSVAVLAAVAAVALWAWRRRGRERRAGAERS
ncbi:MAG: DedA family protein [Nitrososphaerota archaeon]|nr:DedA family protein [Nitrososphaerota archaeon]MDG6939557.1 DedA family protein [Nitrososphaerota archaeon]